MPAKLVGAFHRRVLGRCVKGIFLVKDRDRLAVPFFQGRFIVQHVDVAGAPVGKDENHGFGPGRKMSRPGRQWIAGSRGAKGSLLSQQVLQGQATKTGSGGLEQAATIHEAIVDGRPVGHPGWLVMHWLGSRDLTAGRQTR